MCGRASLTKVEKDLEQHFRATFYSEDRERYQPLPNYNIAPTHRHPVITADDPSYLQFFRWGLIPFWAKTPSIGSKMINARIETVAEKPAFRQAIKKRRCLVPFDGFYEWQRREGKKIPYRITLKDEGIFCTAGIWERWKAPDGELIHSFSVLTQPPNTLMAPIHDRMPAILRPDQEALWLDQELPTEAVLSMIAPYPDEQLKAYTVSSRINSVRNNDPTLLQPYDHQEGEQGSLF
ncbi:MAG: SOS response-associated peptidase [Bacteroidota bacterium]